MPAVQEGRKATAPAYFKFNTLVEDGRLDVVYETEEARVFRVKR
jgi:hypothetical protein